MKKRRKKKSLFDYKQTAEYKSLSTAEKRKYTKDKKETEIKRLGLSGLMKSSTSEKNWKAEIKKAKRKKLRLEKKTYLMQKGIPENRINSKLLSMSWIRIKNIEPSDILEKANPDKVIYSSGDTWLYIGFSDKAGNIDLDDVLPWYEGMPNQYLKNKIETLLAEVKHDPNDGSKGRSGDVLILEGTWKNIQGAIRWGEATGYSTITSNKWTLNGILKVTCCVLEVATETKRISGYRDICRYLKEYMPTLYDKFKI